MGKERWKKNRRRKKNNLAIKNTRLTTKTRALPYTHHHQTLGYTWWRLCRHCAASSLSLRPPPLPLRLKATTKIFVWLDVTKNTERSCEQNETTKRRTTRTANFLNSRWVVKSCLRVLRVSIFQRLGDPIIVCGGFLFNTIAPVFARRAEIFIFFVPTYILLFILLQNELLTNLSTNDNLLHLN